MADYHLTDKDRAALTEWVFTFTEAEVISDPDFRAVERIVRAHVDQAYNDERGRIETGIKVLPDPWPESSPEYRRGWISARGQCARVARNGGSDD